ncbi:unnamed protein product, partial [Nesidiocoris tenuis]
MECARCKSTDQPPDDVTCSICQSRFHAACTRLEGIEKWTRQSKDKRAVWKCDDCLGQSLTRDPAVGKDPPVWYMQLIDDLKNITDELGTLREGQACLQTDLDQVVIDMEGIKSSSTTRQTVSDDIITSLKTENDNLRRQYDQLAREMNKIKSHIATQQSSSINQSLIGSDDALADKLPAYIENELYKVPKLYTENPWSLIKFLDKLFNLNEMNSVFFKQIFRRIATYQQNSILHRLASEQDLNFKKVADELMEELTTPQTKLNLVQEKILRSQNYLENFRTYVDDVIKFNRILSQYSEQDVVKSILQGTNSNTRAKFHFSTRPKNFAELQILVAEVEKLELNENLHKSKTQSRKQFIPPTGPSQTQVEHVEDGRKIRPNHRPYQPNFSAPRFDKTKSVTEQKQQKGATSVQQRHRSRELFHVG